MGRRDEEAFAVAADALPARHRKRWDGRTPLGELPARAAARWGGRESLVFGPVRQSFAEIARRVDEAAKGLISLGVAPGDKVCIWINNCPEWVHLLFAIARIGAILVPANTRLRTGDIEYLVRRAREVFPTMRTLTAYGSTEGGANICVSFLDSTEEQRCETSGHPCDGFEIRIADPETGEDLPAGTPGEILVRGYNLMQGYYRKPGETAAAAVEVDAAAAALGPRGAEMARQHADAVGDGGRGDAGLLAGMGEAAEPGGGLEEPQAVEGRQGNHGFGRREPSGRN